MSEENKEVVRRWFEEVWNSGRAEAIEELFDAEGVAHGLASDGGGELRGPSEFRPFFERFRTAFPDLKVKVVETIAEGELVAARCEVRASHQADTLGFAATQRPVDFEGITIVRVRGGRIVEAWNQFDFLRMFEQLGALRLQPPDREGFIGDL